MSALPVPSPFVDRGSSCPPGRRTLHSSEQCAQRIHCIPRMCVCSKTVRQHCHSKLHIARFYSNVSKVNPYFKQILNPLEVQLCSFYEQCNRHAHAAVLAGGIVATNGAQQAFIPMALISTLIVSKSLGVPTL